MEAQRVKAVHRVEVGDAKGKPSIVVLELKSHRMQVCPPIGKEQRYSNPPLTVLHSVERVAPKDRDPIEWKLLANLPGTNRAAAIEKIDRYFQR